MKKTIVLILLLIPMLCFAGALQEKHRSVIAKKNVPVGGGSENVGNTTNESSDGAIYIADSPMCTKLENTAAHNGTASSMVLRMYCDGNGSSCTVRANIYTDNAGAPNAPVTNAATGDITFTNTSFADITYNYTSTKPSITASTQYWICIFPDTSYTSHVAYKASGTVAYTSGNTYPNWPATYSSSGTQTRTWGKAYIVNDYE
jgi:hypothetical protein